MAAKQTNQCVEEQYDSLTRLARPGDWPRATDEVKHNNKAFADGVIDERLTHFHARRNDHVPGNGWTFYRGTDDADYDYYIVCNNLPQDWTAFGCDAADFAFIQVAFENNPFMLKSEVVPYGG